jgi:hypothetical protein
VTEAWSVDDEVLRALEGLGHPGDAGFIAACLGIREAEAFAALERLAARGLLASGRCWHLAWEGKQ